MPRITNIPSQAVPISSGTDPRTRAVTSGRAGLLAEGQRNISRTLGRMMSRELSNYDTYKKQGDRAKFKASQMMSSALQSVPKAFQQIGLQTIETLDQIEAINEAERETLELGNEEMAFGAVLDMTGDSAYALGKKSAEENVGADGKMPNGKTVSQELVDNVDEVNKEGVIGKAPSVKSELEAYSKNEIRKIDAQQTGKIIEQDARLNTRLSNTIEGLKSTTAIAKQDPLFEGKLKASVNKVDKLLDAEKNLVESENFANPFRRAGISEEQIELRREEAKAKIEQTRNDAKVMAEESVVDGHIERGEIEEATERLTDKDSIMNTRFDKAIQKQQEIGKRLREEARNTKIKKETMKVVAQAKQGISITYNSKYAKRAGNLLYQQHLGNHMAEFGGVITPDVSGEMAVDFYQEYPNLPLVPDHKEKLIGMIKFGTPQEVDLATAQLSALKNNNKTVHVVGERGLEGVLDFTNVYNRKRSFGFSSEEAVEMTRDIVFKKSIDPNIKKEAKSMVNDADFDYNNVVMEMLEESGIFNDTETVNFRSIAAQSKPEFIETLVQTDLDLERTKEIMETKFKNKFRVTTINGRAESMIHAPERYIPEQLMPEFKASVQENLDQISLALGSKGEFLEPNTISYKDSEGNIAVVPIDLKPIDGVTDRSPDESKVYGFFNRDTGQPLRLSQLDPDLPFEQRTFTFDVMKSQTYQEAEQKKEETFQKDKEWRQSEVDRTKAVAERFLQSYGASEVLPTDRAIIDLIENPELHKAMGDILGEGADYISENITGGSKSVEKGKEISERLAKTGGKVNKVLTKVGDALINPLPPVIELWSKTARQLGEELEVDVKEDPEVKKRKQINTGEVNMSNEIVIDTIDNTLKHEGGYVNDPADRGGPTNYGITLKTLRSYRNNNNLDAEDVKNLTRAEAKEIYMKNYMTGPKIDQLPAALIPKVYDIGVNSGPATGIRMLQRAINKTGVDKIAVDGIIGPNTIAASNKVVREKGVEFVNNLVEERNRYYRNYAQRVPSQKRFIKGWLRRSESFRVG